MDELEGLTMICLSVVIGGMLGLLAPIFGGLTRNRRPKVELGRKPKIEVELIHYNQH